MLRGMTSLQCGMCGSQQVLGPTHAKETGAKRVPIDLEFTDTLAPTKAYPEGTTRVFKDVRRASVCLDCGHVALFVSESVRLELLEAAKNLRPVIASE